MNFPTKGLAAKHFLCFASLTGLAWFLRYWFACQDLAYLDRLFLPDDAYYILTISRSLAAGLGPSVDGLHLTSGFQPLVALLQMPLFFLEPTADQAVIWAIYLSAFWGGLSTLVLAYLLFTLANMRVAIIGALLWAFCPIVIKNDLNAMETSLAGCLSLLALLLTVLSDKEKTSFRLFCLGLVCGLVLLARIDSCFLLLSIGFFALWRWGFKACAFVVVFASLAVAPWWAYALKQFGTVVPESGAAIKELIAYHGMSQDFFTISAFYAFLSWFPPFLSSPLASVLGLIFSLTLVTKGAYQAKSYSLLLLGPLLMLFMFYGFYFPVFWFFDRYFYLIHCLILILTALALGAQRKQGAQFLASLTVLLILLGLISNLPSFLGKPLRASDSGLEGAKGYRDVALSLRNYLPPDSILGSMQSGALAYYAPKTVRVINLDGVVNTEAAKALKEKRMKAYVDSLPLNYFADWKFNTDLFKFVYGAVFPEPCFTVIYQAQKQGQQQFTLYHYKPECARRGRKTY